MATSKEGSAPTTEAIAAAIAEHLSTTSTIAQHLHTVAALIAEQKNTPVGAPIQVSEPFVNLKWMLIPLFCSLTGYSDKAIRRKMEDGVWLQGKHYRKAPDGRIAMNLQAYYAWVEGAK